MELVVLTVLCLSVLHTGSVNAFIIDCLSICGQWDGQIHGCFCGTLSRDTESTTRTSLTTGSILQNHSSTMAAEQATITSETSSNPASTVTSRPTEMSFIATSSTMIPTSVSTATATTTTPTVSTTTVTTTSTTPKMIPTSVSTTTVTTTTTSVKTTRTAAKTARLPTTARVSTLSLCDYLCSRQMGGAACSCSIPLVPGRK